MVEILAIARHPGAGSGCQGCDPAVPVPENRTPIFLCALCVRWMELTFAGERRDVSQIAARRAALAETAEPSDMPEPVAA